MQVLVSLDFRDVYHVQHLPQLLVHLVRTVQGGGEQSHNLLLDQVFEGRFGDEEGRSQSIGVLYGYSYVLFIKYILSLYYSSLGCEFTLLLDNIYY